MNKFFFFKQKTAYEMRISDWSSDVCSSDLRQDSNLRPSGPKPDALPGCATPRGRCALAAFIPMWQPEKQENGIWWARRDSNPQPSRYERPALPLSYRPPPVEGRSEEHTSELQSLMRNSSAGFCLTKIQ